MTEQNAVVAPSFATDLKPSTSCVKTELMDYSLPTTVPDIENIPSVFGKSFPFEDDENEDIKSENPMKQEMDVKMEAEEKIEQTAESEVEKNNENSVTGIDEIEKEGESKVQSADAIEEKAC